MDYEPSAHVAQAEQQVYSNPESKRAERLVQLSIAKSLDKLVWLVDAKGQAGHPCLACGGTIDVVPVPVHSCPEPAE